MNAEQLQATMDRAYDTRTPLLIEGKPGGGKTYNVHQFAERRGLDIRTGVVSTMSPLDICTYMPVKGQEGRNGKLRPFYNSLWPDANDPEMADTKGIIFLDEFGDGLMEVQNAMKILIQFRALGDLIIPEGWSFIAATNRAEDRAGAGRFGTALANRFSIVTLDFDAKLLHAHARLNGWNPLVVSFIEEMSGLEAKKCEDILYNFSPEKKVFSSPRQWEKVAKDMDYTERTGVEAPFEYIVGLVSEGPAREFETYRQFWSKLPKLHDIIASPESTRVPSKADELYAISNLIAGRAAPANIGQVVKYVDRLPDEIAARLIKLWSERKRQKKFKNGEDFTKIPAFNKWFMQPRYQGKIDATFGIAA